MDTVKSEMEKIEPFDWMDTTMKRLLENRLPPEQMKKLDECARANFAGQRIMARALRNALNKLKN